jgi:anaerobic dimethyl sulfoxide reductase subunit B (iron-sulfur subunit)
VFAYYVSLACNHCRQPICAEVCPAQAITKRADGIVLIDADECLGCQDCSQACPYNAPQYDDQAGRMTKCTFCVEDLEAGLPPACVAACPMRALDFGDMAALEARYGTVSQVYPLPQPVLTEPALVITPHKDAVRAAGESPRLGNLGQKTSEVYRIAIS